MIWFALPAALALLTILGLAVLVVTLARKVVMPRKPKLHRIHASTNNTVTLDADRKTTHPGEFGLWFNGDDHAHIGEVLSSDTTARTVTREVVVVTSGELSTATEGRWTGSMFAGPEALDTAFKPIDIPVADGIAPAWLITAPSGAEGSVWAIHIHGIRTTRIVALRSVPAAAALGFPSLVVSFRGDTEGPQVPRGASMLGLDEWHDVDEAIAYALAHGASRVVLFGWSMGAGVALLLTERSKHRKAIAGLVLIAPATDWRTVIHHGARQAHLPGWLGSGATLALAGKRTSRLVGLPHAIDFHALDWTQRGRLAVPTLVIHSDGDREIPVTLSRTFVEANPAQATLKEIDGAAHAWEYNINSAGFTASIVQWGQRTLTLRDPK